MSMPLVISRLQESRPCIQAIGRKPNKLMIVGEAPGAEEEKLGIPFVGSAGQELGRMAKEAGLPLASAYQTNVFWTRPINNNLATIFLPIKEWKAQFNGEALPPFKIDNKVHLLPPAFAPELERLWMEIEEVKPNLILALGATALWALTGRQNISSVRGTTLLSAPRSTSRYKVLPTYHPSAVLRQWDLRTIVLADFLKATRQMEYPEIRRPARTILCNPTLQELQLWLEDFLADPPPALAVDVETRLGQITEIGFSPSIRSAVVVPFIRDHNQNYWPTEEDEICALRIVKQVLQSPVSKVFQNGLYDIQYIWKTWRFPPRACNEDTMLKHHSLFPELQKGLGFMGSIYTEEPAWKLMRLKKETEGKADDE
jgi:uracil-DNA glycosylase